MRVLALSPARVESLRHAADWAAVALVASLPWSTSATGILTVAWLLLALPTIAPRDLLAEIRNPRSAIGYVVVAALAVAILWSIGTWRDVSIALGSVVKLLALPVLVCHLRGRKAAWWAIMAFLATVAVVLALSWVAFLWPSGPWRWMPQPAVATHDYGIQNVLFAIAAFIAAHLAFDSAKAGRRTIAAGYLVFTALLVANIVYIQVSRTTMFVIPVLALIFAWQRTGSLRPVALALAAVAAVAGAAWTTSENLRSRAYSVIAEIDAYRADRTVTSSGLRLDWYLRSATLFGGSPILGYGAGGTRAAIAEQARAERLDPAFVTSNPHNQMMWFGLQLGAGGVILMLLLWVLHARSFVVGGTGAMIGFGLVAQNVVYGQLNSYLTDYTNGWTYVLLVGICMALSDSERSAPHSR